MAGEVRRSSAGSPFQARRSIRRAGLHRARRHGARRGYGHCGAGGLPGQSQRGYLGSALDRSVPRQGHDLRRASGHSLWLRSLPGDQERHHFRALLRQEPASDCCDDRISGATGWKCALGGSTLVARPAHRLPTLTQDMSGRHSSSIAATTRPVLVSRTKEVLPLSLHGHALLRRMHKFRAVASGQSPSSCRQVDCFDMLFRIVTLDTPVIFQQRIDGHGGNREMASDILLRIHGIIAP